jgi:murein DD-endopeptidase MepM/ murein hydrolase activator NlpD
VPAAAPLLWLPTPPGQEWRIIQGYGCGTHDDWDTYSIDLAAARGSSAGAVVYAAASGTVLAWVPSSGTLILHHGGDLYTMYTHMSHTVVPRQGQPVVRGDPIGLVGDRGAPGNPHLHFTAFRASGPWGKGERRSIPLRFVDGFDLPALGGCDQHNSRLLTATARAVRAPVFELFLPAVRR